MSRCYIYVLACDESPIKLTHGTREFPVTRSYDGGIVCSETGIKADDICTEFPRNLLTPPLSSGTVMADAMGVMEN